MSRIRNIALVFVAIALVGVLAVGQGLLPLKTAAQTTTSAASEADASDVLRTITVLGKGTVSTQPDTAQANLGVETVGENVKEATAESSEIMEAIIAALTELDIAERDIQTTNFGVWTERKSGPDGRLSDELTYRVTNTVTVQVRELDQLGAVLDAAIDAGANSVYGVNFYLEESAKAESQAREKAVADALAKATELAGLTEVEVGKVISISEVIGGSSLYSNFNAREMAVAGLGGGVGPINPGELDLSLTLQVTYAIQ